MISFLLLVKKQIQDNFEKNLADIDLVIGAKGSPLQMILCSMYHVDNPTGNIALSEVQAFMNPNHPLIKMAVPLSIGDNYQGFRIIGTTTDFLQLYQAGLQEGKIFTNQMEVCIGSEVSKSSALKIGDEFQSTHGLINEVSENSHEENFKVCGILKKSGTVLDHLIITPLESIWTVHEPHHVMVSESEKSITSLLVKYRNRSNFQVLNLPRNINENTNLQAAVPAIEMNRLYVLLGTAEKALRILAFAIIVVSGISVFLSLLNALKERKYELSLMRVLGASGFRLFGLILSEAAILSVIGSIAGLLLSHMTMAFLDGFVRNSYKYSFSALAFVREELFLVFSAILIGICSGIIPAFMAYRTRISTSLGQN